MISLRFRSTLAALLFSIFAACPRAEAQQKPDAPPPKTLADLQEAMRKVVAETKIPGAGVALVANGQVLWCGGFGMADIAAKREITCDTEFRVGSISKTLVAIALLQLEQAGKIDLRARLKDVAPEVPMQNRWDATDPVRVVNLLEHTAGFDDMHFSEVYNLDGPTNLPLLTVFQQHPGPQDVRWPPSTRFSYSNPGYGVAGYLIEKISGQPFDAYIRKNVLAPLQFSAADFALTDANRALLAQGYEATPPRPVPYREIYLRPAGDLKASPAELAKLIQFFLRRGIAGDTQLLKPENITRMELPETSLSARNGLRIGYGLANYSQIQSGVVTHGHDGGIDGFISTYRYMPEQNWGFVVLLNTDSSGAALRRLSTLAADFLSKDFPKPQQPVISLPAAELEKFTGYYASSAPRSQLFVFLDDLFGGHRIRVQKGILLRSDLFGAGQPLYPVGKSLFRSEKDPEATAVFFTDAAGKMCYSASGSSGEPYGERSSILFVYARLAVLVLCGLIFASAVLYAVIWLLMLLFGKLREVKHLAVRVTPFLAILFFCLAFFAGVRSFSNPRTVNIWSALVFVATVLLPLLSLIGLWLAVRVPRAEIHRGVRIHSLIVSTACCVVTAFMAYWHLIAVRFWAP